MADPLIKLYAGLTDHERGKMAYAYLLQGNDLERKRIEAAMPVQYFTGLPLEYRSWIDSLQSLAMLYAVDYWQKVANCLTMMAGAMAQLQDDDPETCKPMMERFKAAESVLLAIEQAFDDVCLDHGLDSDLMRGMAGKQFYECATPDLQPDDAYLVGYREAFEKVLAV